MLVRLAQDLSDLRQMTGKCAQTLFDALFVTNIGKDII
jgi:hypothetical protein